MTPLDPTDWEAALRQQKAEGWVIVMADRRTGLVLLRAPELKF